MSKKTHVVGVKIEGDTARATLSDKIYYYKTDKQYMSGQQIKIRVPTGGRPDSVVVVADSAKSPKGLKTLQEVNK